MLAIGANGLRFLTTQRRLLWASTNPSSMRRFSEVVGAMAEKEFEPKPESVREYPPVDISESKFGPLGLNEKLLQGLAAQSNTIIDII